MKTIQKIGAFASVMFGISFVALFILLAVVSSQGYTPDSGNNPAKALAFASSSPIPFVIYLLYMLFAVLFILIVVALADMLQEQAPAQMRLARIAASATSILFLVYAMLGYVGETTLINIYQQDASLGMSAYAAIRICSNALNTGAIFAAGWAILLTGLAMLNTRIHRLLAWLLIAAGSLSVTAFLVPIFALVTPLLYIVWSIWLGITLLKMPDIRFRQIALIPEQE